MNVTTDTHPITEFDPSRVVRTPADVWRIGALDAQRDYRLATIDPVTGHSQPLLIDGTDLANTPVAHMTLAQHMTMSVIPAPSPDTTDPAAHTDRARMFEHVQTHEAAGGRVEATRDDNGRWVVRWTRDGQPWRDTTGCRRIGVVVEYLDGSPTKILTVDGELIDNHRRAGGQPVPGVFERNLPRRGKHVFAPTTGCENWMDRTGQGHRDDGPAYLSPELIIFCQHGAISRDPDQGPAEYWASGEVAYTLNGVRVEPTNEQIARHGVVRDDTGTLRQGGFHPECGDLLLDWYDRALLG